MMNGIVKAYPELKLSSLPQFIEVNGKSGRIIEFSLRGNPDSVPRAMAEMKAHVKSLGFDFDVKA
jgi:hypothetical protein